MMNITKLAVRKAAKNLNATLSATLERVASDTDNITTDSNIEMVSEYLQKASIEICIRKSVYQISINNSKLVAEDQHGRQITFQTLYELIDKISSIEKVQPERVVQTLIKSVNNGLIVDILKSGKTLPVDNRTLIYNADFGFGIKEGAIVKFYQSLSDLLSENKIKPESLL